MLVQIEMSTCHQLTHFELYFVHENAKQEQQQGTLQYSPKRDEHMPPLRSCDASPRKNLFPILWKFPITYHILRETFVIFSGIFR